MTRFWFIRHGPTHQKAFTGWRDVPADLSDKAALARLSSALPATARVISSDLVRASATADALTGPRDRLDHDPALREFHFGDWDGKHWSDVAASHPQLSRDYWERPGDIAPPAGESWNAASARVSDAVRRLLLPQTDVIVVAHFGAILTQVQQARGQTPFEALAQRIEPLSLTRLDFDGQIWRTHFVNRQL